MIARHTGDYASLYAAASDYLDQAGSDEKVTPAWKDQKQAVLEGFAAARASFGKAPVTGNDADPVRALLDKAPTQNLHHHGFKPGCAGDQRAGDARRASR